MIEWPPAIAIPFLNNIGLVYTKSKQGNKCGVTITVAMKGNIAEVVGQRSVSLPAPRRVLRGGKTTNW